MMGQVNGLDMPIEDVPRALVDHLYDMGFTPETHPHLLRDMLRMFKEETATAGLREEDKISVRFSFDADGCTGVEIRKD